jgi:hypothetical protein
MSYFQTAVIAAAQIGKLAAVMNSRISKPHVQTIFNDVDIITPHLKKVKAVMDTSSMRAMRALMSVNPLAGRI